MGKQPLDKKTVQEPGAGNTRTGNRRVERSVLSQYDAHLRQQ